MSKEIESLDTTTRALEEGFDFVAIGRALIRDPDLVRRMAAGEITASTCVPCNQCMAYVGVAPTRCRLDERGEVG